MKIANAHHNNLKKVYQKIIERHLGDVSDLPKGLIKHIHTIYFDFITSYLNLLRQKEQKPADWVPETLSIDTSLADEMRHFFSDYQHIARAFYRLSHEVGRLRKIDKNTQPNLYQHTIDSITIRSKPRTTLGKQNEESS